MFNKKEPEKIIIEGKELECPFCENNEFHTFDVKLNTFHTSYSGGFMSFFAKKAKAYVCSNCGLKQEFVEIKK